ncbi:1,6-dihydroxycyclohexa-2,4-diene-1-carboxylate dehydrogenase [Burkholderia oklahomensis]|uniref:1,6-dihydroxycyclohexa-2,4-diene-1-carboxylate dehydrogenase n=1 Tax=Burkholderia oklahomensis TaxID=342113 RepID=UPI00016A9EF3|nr:1,6-dihydroxycyclohexa-2,4-diene-1-carboxylate dehydrogenase [Burkholderia oklahomensis]AJX35328.1 short chain dehydrogenase family protein [Burkholderia oklahomensis C6786]AOI48230.1 1,6-dihydroxycyclohexa-2,4-diene-1-carboxylate dehydrogenase [Burkholderia oklahomensis C6786]KUY49900.1 1,6-dihydroxycyclohexa-2,4-diene-1-carboxylate dehydrogenase [Burkholderia oklahomensis C6786]MBI0363632.1 1,6-dihydroxycyclohexa-2,4-diene-1-carboxylate dehydrogenase [Burkholderia oklahomensis]SUY27756.1 
MNTRHAPGRFNRQVMIVTGAAQGIGRGVALRAAREGATTVLVDRADFVHDVAAEIASQGCRTLAVVADLETYAGAETMARAAIDAFGRIDVLVNNVGGTIWTKPFDRYEVAQIEAEIRRSLFPTLWCCRAVLPGMIERGGGAIVNVSSIATRSIHRVPYAAAKGGVNALTASLAFEHAAHGIRVNAVAAGGTDAPPRKVPRNVEPQRDDDARWYRGIVDQTLSSSLMHRYGTIDEQVAAILFLASDEASYITGSVLPVGGGDQG